MVLFSNRVLLRVRMLYYIKHEVIGDMVQQIADNVPSRYVSCSFRAISTINFDGHTSRNYIPETITTECVFVFDEYVCFIAPILLSLYSFGR